MSSAAPYANTPAGGSQRALRDANTRRVLDALMANGPMAQVALAKSTGLSSATISNIVHDLAAGGSIATEPTTVSGRRGVLVRLVAAPRSRVALGVDFGRRHVRIVVAASDRTVVAEDTLELQLGHSAERAIQLSTRFLDRLLASRDLSRADVVGCGVGIPGPIDRRTGAVVHGAILPEWVGFQLTDRLEEAWDLPVLVDNDANLGALGEVTWGPYAEDATIIFVKVGTGIGAGLALEGQLHRGRRGLSGEIGHTTVEELGPICRCGNRGCLESVASTQAMLTALHGPGDEPWTMTRLTEAIAARHPAALRVVEDAGHALGRVLGGAVNVLAPDAIVIGGPVLPVGEALLTGVRRGVQRYATPILSHDMPIELSSLGERGEALGACTLVFQNSPAEAWELAGNGGTR